MHKGKSHTKVKRKIGVAKPKSMVTRKVTQGPNKGDTVKFTANSANAAQPGKLKPRLVVKDVGAKNTSTIPKKKDKKKKRSSHKK